MCTVCGCSSHDLKIEGHEKHGHAHAGGTAPSHRGAHHHGHDLHYGLGSARAHAAGMSQAHMVGHAPERLQPKDNSLLLIENVGNLVCPAAFDLGEAHKVAILSVTEGEDKPLKYPGMFAAADLMLLNKADLLPHLDFDVPLAIKYARRINPGIRVIVTSARSGEGMDEWLGWLDERMAAVAMRREAAAEQAGQHAAPEAELTAG
ncbi:MAG: hydrogenase accessory protein HypB [Gallionellales bacterium RIFCSPLOWO2_12_FULL_59_22]|nr:MAG: hydrogenase accessory protein HypB [Gallionellales bacterium RIFCSPLOWO2_02_FULL_59_110]OGT14690.1 MAG: hydrogenase accessory protein HypB [Gallionellales bacterium RIFCSPLOWO2_12_FULL_59_22]